MTAPALARAGGCVDLVGSAHGIPCACVPVPGREAVIKALYKFIAQRSGMDARLYGDRASYLADYREILRDGRDARRMLHSLEVWNFPPVTGAKLMEAARGSRLNIFGRPDGGAGIDYTAGQFFAVEYRAAVCRLLAGVLWVHWREYYGDTTAAADKRGAADYIRAHARRRYGRGLAGRWFK